MIAFPQAFKLSKVTAELNLLARNGMFVVYFLTLMNQISLSYIL